MLSFLEEIYSLVHLNNKAEEKDGNPKKNFEKSETSITKFVLYQAPSGILDQNKSVIKAEHSLTDLNTMEMNIP